MAGLVGGTCSIIGFGAAVRASSPTGMMSPEQMSAHYLRDME